MCFLCALYRSNKPMWFKQTYVVQTNLYSSNKLIQFKQTYVVQTNLCGLKQTYVV
ncbi:MAG: hypothetical protein RI894_860 [Bacteroidota bacterium]